MSLDWKAELPHWVLLAGMFGLAFVARSIPDLRVPMQWGLSGEVNRYAEGPAAAFMLPFFALFIYVLLLARGTGQTWSRGAMRLGVTLVLAGAYAVSVMPLLG